MPYSDLISYLEPTHFANTDTTIYNKQQLGASILTNINNTNFDLAQVIIVGCGERRGQNINATYSNVPNIIRSHFYKMYYWHKPIVIADIGNVTECDNAEDTKAALTYILETLHKLNKIVIVIGGSHDLTICQYNVFKNNKEMIDATVVDMLIDLAEHEKIMHDNFLYPMLTESPNYVRHFNIIGFQSFYTNPIMIETLDRLHFDCHRLGKVREDLNEMEPILRHSDMLSFDINAVRNSDAPCNKNTSPNGLHGDEACQLTRYAGMSDKCCSLGIYGYNEEDDTNEMTARLFAQMIWYFIDGVYYKQQEVAFTNKEMFNEFNVNMNGQLVLFLQSKRTQRWWLQLPSKQFIPCTHKDYVIAANNDLPERWLREMERIV